MIIEIDNKNFSIPEDIVINEDDAVSVIKKMNQHSGECQYMLLVSPENHYQINLTSAVDDNLIDSYLTLLEQEYGKLGISFYNNLGLKQIATKDFVVLKDTSSYFDVYYFNEEGNLISQNYLEPVILDQIHGLYSYELKYNNKIIYKTEQAKDEEGEIYFIPTDEIYRYPTDYNANDNFLIPGKLAYKIVESIRRAYNLTNKMDIEEIIEVINNQNWEKNKINMQGIVDGSLSSTILRLDNLPILNLYPFTLSRQISELILPNTETIAPHALSIGCSLYYKIIIDYLVNSGMPENEIGALAAYLIDGLNLSTGLKLFIAPKLLYISEYGVQAPITTFIAPKLLYISMYGLSATSIDKLKLQSMLYLSGQSLVYNQSLKEAYFPNLQFCGAFAFADNNLLRIIDLGKVETFSFTEILSPTGSDNKAMVSPNLQRIILRNPNVQITPPDDFSIEDVISMVHPNFKIVFSRSALSEEAIASDSFVASLCTLPEENYFYLEDNYYMGLNETKQFTYDFLSIDNELTCNVTSSNENIIVNNIILQDEKLSFNINTLNVACNAIITIEINNDIGESISHSFTIESFENPYCTYSVDTIEGAQNFVLNEKGFYQNSNQYQPNSYCMSRVNVHVEKKIDLFFDCINYSGTDSDYGVLSNINTALGVTFEADDSSLIKRSFHNATSAYDNYTTVQYTLDPGDYFIDIKYANRIVSGTKTKDSDKNKSIDGAEFEYEDSFQFRIRYEEWVEPPIEETPEESPIEETPEEDMTV